MELELDIIWPSYNSFNTHYFLVCRRGREVILVCCFKTKTSPTVGCQIFCQSCLILVSSHEQNSLIVHCNSQASHKPVTMTLPAGEDARDTVSIIAAGISRHPEMRPPRYSSHLGSPMGDRNSESSLYSKLYRGHLEEVRHPWFN